MVENIKPIKVEDSYGPSPKIHFGVCTTCTGSNAVCIQWSQRSGGCCTHLDGSGRHVRLLYVDFSSAFNTVHFNQTAFMSNSLFYVKVGGLDSGLLTKRKQRVKLDGVLLDLKCSSTGSPQGCVLSSLLFILYTSMYQS